MATFRAYAEYSTMLMIEFEADSMTDAIDKASETDGGDWLCIGGDGWTVTDIEEVQGA